MYAEYKEAAGKGVTAKAFKSKYRAVALSQGMVNIDAYATNAAALTRSLRALGATKVKARGPLVSAQVPVKRLGQIAALHIAAFRAAGDRDHQMRCRRGGHAGRRVAEGSGGACRERRGRIGDHGGHAVGQLQLQSAAVPAGGAELDHAQEDIANDELPADTTILDEGTTTAGARAATRVAAWRS